MQKPATAPRMVEIATLGERLSALRLCDADALTAMRRSLEQHGQLSALTLFLEPRGLEIVDDFKRVRALGWSTLLAHVDELDAIDARQRSYPDVPPRARSAPRGAMTLALAPTLARHAEHASTAALFVPRNYCPPSASLLPAAAPGSVEERPLILVS